ncbi:MAG: hypothetical protein IPL28_00330 [Chloroflexi bacterium]|nr:hypothetical protein [Chloroflexota bacterium]
MSLCHPRPRLLSRPPPRLCPPPPPRPYPTATIPPEPTADLLHTGDLALLTEKFFVYPCPSFTQAIWPPFR